LSPAGAYGAIADGEKSCSQPVAIFHTGIGQLLEQIDVPDDIVELLVVAEELFNPLPLDGVGDSPTPKTFTQFQSLPRLSKTPEHL
jgi:hypothetical protein